MNVNPEQPALRRPLPKLLGWILRATFGLLALIVGLVLTMILVARFNLHPIQAAPADPSPFRFDGAYLLGVSDADMVGTAYADGVLKQIPGLRDTLTMVQLPMNSSQAAKREVIVSNSVTSWPQVMAVSPDGRRVYIVETAAEVDDSVGRLASNNMPEGRHLTIVDTASATIAARVDVGQNPISIAISRDGRFLLIGLTEPGRQLAILPTANLDDPQTFRFFSIPTGTGLKGVRSVAWHPGGRFIAVNSEAQQVRFYALQFDGDTIGGIEAHGDPIVHGNTITEGEFTPDGRHYVTAEVNWSVIPRPLGNLVNPPGQLIVTRFDDTAQAQHSQTARVNVAQSPEGIAISPDGTLIVTVDMRRTYLPDALAFWPGADQSAVTLASLEPSSGEVRVLGSYGFDGVLPEDAVFDVDGDALAVTIYNDREVMPKAGALEFWRVVRDPEPRLVRTTTKLETTRGIHNLGLIPVQPR